MSEQRVLRRLAAILAADVVGYSRLMQQDEAKTLADLKARRKVVLDPLVSRHNGRVFKVTGDGVLVEFASAVDAVQCAIELQRRMTDANAGQPEDRNIVLRIGINLADVMSEGTDLYGDGVNIAARLQAVAEPGGILISGAAHDHVRNKVKAHFDDAGNQNLKNIAEPVRAYRVAGTPMVTMAASKAPTDKSSIAVLPFVNMSRNPEQEYFADGLTEDIITALSRISGLLVIARTSTFTYKGQSADIRRVARELGVRYVLEGSVQRSGERLRVTAQLIDAVDGHHLWVEKYDRAVADVFDIQDEITRNVAASTETQLIFAERQAVEAKPPEVQNAADLVKRGLARAYDETPEALQEAGDFAEQAIRIDPTYPPAHLLRANVFLHLMAFGGIPTDSRNVARGLELASAALRLNFRDERAHWLVAVAHGRAGNFNDAVAACEHGLSINPNSHLILGDMGIFLAALGRTAEAIDACRLALRLSPRDPSNFWRHAGIATAHFVSGDYEAALQEAKVVARSRPTFLRGHLLCAAAAAALDRPEEAQVAVRYCLAQQPSLRTRDVAPRFIQRFARDSDHERLVAMLRKAGLQP
jgi:TolB-like protein/cytochrome c-type biogenesis protein CcmH/NrfG